MVKTPKDKIDADDYDSLSEYIASAMDEGYTLDREDFEGRPCSYCGEMISFVDWPETMVSWDIRVQEPGEDPEPYFARYYFCSEGCKHDAMRDGKWLSGDGEHGSDDRIHEDDLEGLV